jgi:hypothetical protein
MTDERGRLFGEQFDEARFKKGQEADDIVQAAIEEAFGAKNIVAIEDDEAYDNFRDNKHIHEILDYSGIDYLVDTFHEPAFGINHRNHFKSYHSLFDIRADTGSRSPSELDKLQKAHHWDIVPKYATRMKIPQGEDVEWFRVIDLPKFIKELDNGLSVTKEWEDYDNNVTAWMFDYDDLRDRDIAVDEIEP